MNAHVTIELTPEQKARLEILAAREDLDLSAYLLRIAEQELRRDADWVALIQEGVEFAETGRVFSHEEVVRRSEARKSELLKAATKA